MVVAEIVLLVGVILIIALIFFLLKRALILAVNSVIGFFALWAASLIFRDLVINFWSVIIVAIGGIIGFAGVLILHILGIAF